MELRRTGERSFRLHSKESHSEGMEWYKKKPRELGVLHLPPSILCFSPFWIPSQLISSGI